MNMSELLFDIFGDCLLSKHSIKSVPRQALSNNENTEKPVSEGPIIPNKPFKNAGEPKKTFLSNACRALRDIQTPTQNQVYNPQSKNMETSAKMVFNSQIIYSDELDEESSIYYEELEFTKPTYKYDNYHKNLVLQVLEQPSPPNTPPLPEINRNMEFGSSYEDDFFIDDFAKGSDPSSFGKNEFPDLIAKNVFISQIIYSDELDEEERKYDEELEFTKPTYKYDNYHTDLVDYLQGPELQVLEPLSPPNTPPPPEDNRNMEVDCSYEDDFFIDDFTNGSDPSSFGENEFPDLIAKKVYSQIIYSNELDEEAKKYYEELEFTKPTYKYDNYHTDLMNYLQGPELQVLEPLSPPNTPPPPEDIRNMEFDSSYEDDFFIDDFTNDSNPSLFGENEFPDLIAKKVFNSQIIYSDELDEEAGKYFEELEFSKPTYKYDNYHTDLVDYLQGPELQVLEPPSPPNTPPPPKVNRDMEFDCSYEDDFFTDDFAEGSSIF